MPDASHTLRLDRVSILTHSRLRQWCVGVILLVSVAIASAGLGLSWYAAGLCVMWGFTARLQARAMDRAPGPTRMADILFGMVVVDTLVATGLVGLTGSVLWCGAVMYVFIAIAAGSMLPASRARLIGVIGVGALGLLLALQVQGMLPGSDFLYATSLRGQWRTAAVSLLVIASVMIAIAVMEFQMTVMLRQRAVRYRVLMDTATDLFVVLRHDGTVSHANRATLALAHCDRKSLLRAGLASFLGEEEIALIHQRLQRVQLGEQQTLTLHASAFHGSRWFSCTLAAISPGLTRSDVLAIFRDVTEDRLAAETLQASEARLRAVFDQAAIAIALLDLDGCFVQVNPAVQRLLGYDEARLIGRRWTAFVPPEELGAADTILASVQASQRETVTHEQRFVRHDGRVLWAMMTVTRVENPTGAAGLIAMLQDVTERRALEAQLTWQAYHDPLTNLANRTLFRERVDLALARRTGVPGGVAVLFLDLDNFKTINDSKGHAAGDALLFEVGRRLLNATRGCDTVARLGGDEFAILIDTVREPADCVIVAERILASMRHPVVIDGTEVMVSTSIGIVRDTGQESADDILRNADVAMYNAKQGGRARHAEFEPAMHDKAVERMRLQTDLRTAIDAGEITLAFQPIVTLATGTACGFEALARWTHASLGIIAPDTFIPLAEETGLIVPLGRTILLLACEEAARWTADSAAGRPLGISVNLSGRQLEEATLVQDVRDALEESGLAPDRLTLEITETALVHDSEAMRARLFELKALGVTLAIDDFGTGYSSLSYIQQFPVDVLKIDRSFVEGLRRASSTDAALARTIIALGASLRLRTVAEGIELDAQRAILCELGCEFGQGYLYARPMPAADILPWLARSGGMPWVSPTADVPPARGRRGTGEFSLISG